MSIGRFDQVLTFTLVEEGGYSDTPGDAGGPTNLGLTLYGDWWPWQDAHGIKRSTLEEFRDDLTREDAAPVYLEKYWETINDGTLEQPVDAAAFDCCVNEGEGKARQFLDETASITDHEARFNEFQDLRTEHYNAIVAHDPSQHKFLSDWLGRVQRLTAKVQAGVL
jgi:lysozyme family protein